MPRTTIFSNTIAGLSENITVRFDLFGGSNGSNGTFRMDDFVLNGYTAALENWSPAGYRYGYQGSEKDDEVKGSGNSYDFGARMYDSRVGRWWSCDPLQYSSPSYAPYNFAINSPIVFIDPDGEKEKPYQKGKDQPVQEVASQRTIKVYDAEGKTMSCTQNSASYNCHSFTWHNSQADKNPTTQHSEYEWQYDPNIPKWDSDPADDIIEQGAQQLHKNVNNKVGDRVIYYQDDNQNGKWDSNEKIHHSAIVKEVDKKGYTLTVEGKMGQAGTSINHPDAPGYYETDTGESSDIPLSRAYFRRPTEANFQTVGNIKFNSNTVRIATDVSKTKYLIVRSVDTGKDYAVQRQSNGSYKFYTPKKK